MAIRISASNDSTGAAVKTLYVDRVLTAYAVHESEVEMLSYLNTQATVFVSLASALLSFAGGICTNAIFATELTPAGQLAIIIAVPTLGVLALVFIGLSVNAVYRRRTAWSMVRRQSGSGASAPVA